LTGYKASDITTIEMQLCRLGENVMANLRRAPSLLLPSLGRLRGGLVRDLLGGSLLLAVWLFLWSWFLLALTADAARPPFPPAAPAAWSQRA
jgi:hypothetical protein